MHSYCAPRRLNFDCISVTVSQYPKIHAINKVMYRILSPFWNWQERRVRSGWRLLLQLVGYVAGQASPLALIGDPENGLLPSWAAALPLTKQALFIILGCIASLLITWLVTLILDRRRFADIGFQIGRDWWVEFGFGLLLGALLMGLIFVVELGLGWIEITDYFRVKSPDQTFWGALLSPLMLFIGVGIQEELLSRGYQIRNLAEGVNFERIGHRWAIMLAWIATSAFFGLLHAANPNSTWISTFNIALAGIFLGVGYVLTGRLALSIGLHITWNLFQGNFFGFPVSGNDFADVTLIAVKQVGPTLWTGGAFGPEAGLIGIAAITLGTLIIITWVRRRYGSSNLQQEIAIYPYRRQSNKG